MYFCDSCGSFLPKAKYGVSSAAEAVPAPRQVSDAAVPSLEVHVCVTEERPPPLRCGVVP